MGREFWFAAPDITVDHGDEPIVFRITAIETNANVTVSMPADGGRVIKNLTINAQTQERIDLNKNVVENRPSNRVNNKGILITSDADITVYYEVANGVNPDKFTLKGPNGLGDEFFIPSQNTYQNKILSPKATEKADIVATEDGTKVTIIPTVNIVGHAAGVEYTITLNRGQTYSLENRNDGSPTSSMAGTYISSDKDIAVTISDDSVWQGRGFGPYDLIGDQMIPTSMIGTEYIAVNPNPDSRTINKVYVLATEDDTYISVVYETDRVTKRLNKGEQADLDIDGNALFIDADKPVYAYQLASLWNTSGNEMGSAILPSTSCTGSRTVSFVRTFNLEFWVQLLTQQKNLSSFVFRDQNGNVRNDLDAITWEEVKGTDTGLPEETWYSGIIQLGITTGAPHTIENTNGLFHMSVLDENQGSTSYGYFSSYGQLRLEGPTQECQGNQIILRTAEPMKSYNWFSELTGNVVQSTDPTFAVTQSGKYWVTAEVNFGGCELTDSIDVEFRLPEFDLGNDTVVCPGETVDFQVPPGLGTYEWFDGTSSNSTSVVMGDGDSHDVWLTVTDDLNCSNTDRKQVTTHPLPLIVLNRTELCQGERIIADDTNIERFEWRFNGALINADPTQSFIEPSLSGRYSLTVWGAEGCSVVQDFDVTVHDLPDFDLTDQLGCIATTTTINAPLTGAGFTYRWSDNSTASSIDLNVAGDYWLEITDAFGCMSRDNFNFDFLPPEEIDLGPDRVECAGVTLEIEEGSDYSNFVWEFKQNGTGSYQPLTTPSPEYKYTIVNSDVVNSGDYKVSAINKHGCAVEDMVNVVFQTTDPPVVTVDRNLCQGETIHIEASSIYTDYEWHHNGVHRPEFDGQNRISVDQPGVYKVSATYGVCTKETDVDVKEYSLPSIALNAPSNICSDSASIIDINSFTEGDAPFNYLVFDDGLKQYNDWTTAENIINASGTYKVTAYDEAGCVASDQVIINLFPRTDIGLSDIPPTCENIDVVLENPVASALSYDWYKIESSADNHLVSNAPWTTNVAGSYKLFVEDINGCGSLDTAVVQTLPVPTVDLGVDREMCEGEQIMLGAGSTYATYKWNDDNALMEPSLLVTSAGKYKIEVGNIHGCTAKDSVQIDVNPIPRFTVADVYECAGELGRLTVPAGVSNYHWSTGSTSSSIDVTKGKYVLTSETAKGCVGTDTAEVIWHPVPEVAIGADTAICPVNNIRLEATSGYADYKWHNGDVGPITYSNFSDTVNVVTVTDVNGCKGFDTRMVHALPAPDYELCPDTAICTGETLLLDAGMDYLSYLWKGGGDGPTLEVNSPGKYWVSVRDECFIYSDTTEVVYVETPVIARLDTMIYGQIGILAEGGTEPYRYAINDEDWQDEGLFIDLENGRYIVQVQDVNLCMTTDTVNINSIIDIEIPNFVTPNNDGTNDRWEIKGMEKFPDSIIKIYDRFGKLLIEYKASEPGWNGEYLNKPVPSDAYWYVIEVLPLRKMLKGHITLKR
ncbi:MAG: T9SS type B sorting domain-containing protein [Carboxylicivirga sp.]|nr:T9SS type B sorting domain-containing protein [Carboxylicivirga sp.]